MFTNKTVIVTGAAQGIWRSIAEHFAAEKARVIGLDIEKRNCKESNTAIAMSANSKT